MEKDSKLLEIKDLKVVYNTDDGLVHAVDNLNLAIGIGETLGFVGETGAGKTTSALAVMGLVPEPAGKIEGGQIIFKGQNLVGKTKKELKKIRGKEIAMIFQDPMTSLNPVLTVGDQIAEMILIHESIGKKEAMEKAKKLLNTVGIKEERVNDYPHQFSGGMKQRVVIAIAIACNPELLIADEPTTALDVTIQAQILDLMKNLKKEYGMSMIMITHDLGIVAEICDKVAIMYAGGVVEFGDKKSLFLSPKHPYTNGLFDSIPDLDMDEIDHLNEIDGLPPDPINLPPGCVFYPRCKKAMDKCKNQKPDMVKVDSDHSVKCFLYE